MFSTSGFVDDVMFSYHGATGSESSSTLCSEVCPVATPVGLQDVYAVFGRVHQNAAPGMGRVEVCSLRLPCETCAVDDG